MDFFGEQRSRTRRSLLLYGLFFLIIFAHIAVALGVMSLLLTIFTGGIYYWALILVVVWTIGSFVIGSFLEYGRLAAGGRAIAQRVGAVRLFIDHSQDAWEHSQGVAHQHEPVQKVRFSARHIAVRDERDFPPVYRRYHEIAQQLAIASGLSMPILYVLPDEQGINGFVAGRHSQDMVLVVTQGALDKLSDEALYGLIGHEYGHILHGDATFNLQLMVVLAGLQLLYDWSAAVNNFGASSQHKQHNYFDGSFINSAVNQSNPLPQRGIDNHARSTEAQTASFTTHNEWVTYWKNQSQSQQSSAKVQPMWLQNSATTDRQAPRNIWTLLIHGLSFSSMASAQLIKHSFNRERELLADATSLQLTRSPAIMETLQAIHRDSFGSRLTGIADINGLSHFFFASSGTDLGDVSWFATHPSLTERMSAINGNAYQDFAVQVAKEKRLNQQKIKEIYEQRRLGDWGVVTANSLSKDKQINNTAQSSVIKNQTASIDKSTINNPDDVVDDVIDKEVAAFSTEEIENQSETEAGLEFIVESDVVIDGRLQVAAESIGCYKLLKPSQAKADSDLPDKALISIDDMQKVSLPHYVLNYSHHPLGAQALIEAVMLCHRGGIVSTTAVYDLVDIWTGVASDELPATDEKVLPHTIDHKLLEMVAAIDRRLDSALIALAIKRLGKHDLSSKMIQQLQQESLSSHTYKSHEHYQQQLKSRTMLLRYQQGLLEFFNTQLVADITEDLITDVDSHMLKNRATAATSDHSSAIVTKTQQPTILSLWQALHLQQLLPVLSQALGDDDIVAAAPYQQVLHAGLLNITEQLDPSGQLFTSLGMDQQMLLIVFAYRLAKNNIEMSTTSVGKYKNYVADLRRHARLVDIDLGAVSDANLQWLLLTTQSLNSIQLLAIISSVTSIKANVADKNQHNAQHDVSELAYNEDVNKNLDGSYLNHKYLNHNSYRLWLSTLHTVMLHDTILTQDEYDCLTMLAEHWLGVRQLFD